MHVIYTKSGNYNSLNDLTETIRRKIICNIFDEHQPVIQLHFVGFLINENASVKVAGTSFLAGELVTLMRHAREKRAKEARDLKGEKFTTNMAARGFLRSTHFCLIL